MNHTNDKEPQPQTASNPAGDAKVDSASANKGSDDNSDRVAEETDREQQFKEAQTEWD